MKYELEEQDKYTVITIKQEKVDSSIAPDVKSKLVKMHAEGVGNLVLNLNDVKYMDSSGLSALLVGNRLFTEDGGDFILCNISDHVMKLINISQLDKVLTIVQNIEEAVDLVYMNELEREFKNENPEE
ncbi:STAS domain-containing protein [Marinigracilibium pacificum]|uniref:Anti-sigma factor antagonist n=1 Tax=Marinigracilibium pacificum TaxID=2729599 RepID=A0A848IVL4_9BACT|nr:STAS domain-containing protein [Marinigracilibium pacificum]NMM48377.1 STAS domain-containing protein [Marinigracilibium pacificum]